MNFDRFQPMLYETAYAICLCCGVKCLKEVLDDDGNCPGCQPDRAEMEDAE